MNNTPSQAPATIPTGMPPHIRPSANQLDTARRLIQKSVRRGGTVVEPFNFDLLEAFAWLGDDSQENNLGVEFTGLLDGSQWRVLFSRNTSQDNATEHYAVVVLVTPVKGYVVELLGVFVKGSAALKKMHARASARVSAEYGGRARVALLLEPNTPLGQVVDFDEESICCPLEEELEGN